MSKKINITIGSVLLLLFTMLYQMNSCFYSIVLTAKGVHYSDNPITSVVIECVVTLIWMIAFASNFRFNSNLQIPRWYAPAILVAFTLDYAFVIYNHIGFTDPVYSLASTLYITSSTIFFILLAAAGVIDMIVSSEINVKKRKLVDSLDIDTEKLSKIIDEVKDKVLSKEEQDLREDLFMSLKTKLNSNDVIYSEESFKEIYKHKLVGLDGKRVNYTDARILAADRSKVMEMVSPGRVIFTCYQMRFADDDNSVIAEAYVATDNHDGIVGPDKSLDVLRAMGAGDIVSSIHSYFILQL